MNRQVSPFAALSGMDKQIRWLEYQSIKLPYVDSPIETPEASPEKEMKSFNESKQRQHDSGNAHFDRPQPSPEVQHVYSSDFQKTRHSQYDAVIARMKQAEMQARHYPSQTFQQ